MDEAIKGIANLSHFVVESGFQKPTTDIAVAEHLVGDNLATEEDGKDAFAAGLAFGCGGESCGDGGESCGVSDGGRVIAGSDGERGSADSGHFTVPSRPVLGGRAEPLTTGTRVVDWRQHSLEVTPIVFFVVFALPSDM